MTCCKILIFFLDSEIWLRTKQ